MPFICHCLTAACKPSRSKRVRIGLGVLRVVCASYYLITGIEKLWRKDAGTPDGIDRGINGQRRSNRFLNIGDILQSAS